MNGSFSRGSLWFNLVTGGQTQHTSSGGTKMAGKWDYSLALPSNRARQLSHPCSSSPKGVELSEKLEEHVWWRKNQAEADWQHGHC